MAGFFGAKGKGFLCVLMGRTRPHVEGSMDLVDCSRYHARITPAACARYREKDTINCLGCVGPGAVQVVDIEEVVMGEIKKTAHGKSTRACVKCGEERAILGRGMCQRCYSKVLYREKAGKAAPLEKIAKETVTSIGEVIANQKEPIFQEGMPAATPCGPFIIIEFRGDDTAIYDKIMSEAKTQRRQPMDQVLWLLDFATRGVL